MIQDRNSGKPTQVTGFPKSPKLQVLGPEKVGMKQEGMAEHLTEVRGRASSPDDYHYFTLAHGFSIQKLNKRLQTT